MIDNVHIYFALDQIKCVTRIKLSVFYNRKYAAKENHYHRNSYCYVSSIFTGHGGFMGHGDSWGFIFTKESTLGNLGFSQHPVNCSHWPCTIGITFQGALFAYNWQVFYYCKNRARSNRSRLILAIPIVHCHRVYQQRKNIKTKE